MYLQGFMTQILAYEFPFRNNSFRFHFAAPFFENEFHWSLVISWKDSQRTGQIGQLITIKILLHFMKVIYTTKVEIKEYLWCGK